MMTGNLRTALIGVLLFAALAWPQAAPAQNASQQDATPPAGAYCPPGTTGQGANAIGSTYKPGQEVPSKPGEICLMCDQPIGRGDIVYRINGQRVPVHRGACDTRFRANPQLTLAKLQPGGAFLGTGPQGRSLSRLWFLVGLYILIALFFAALCAQRALHRGRSPAAWFALGLIFSVAGYLALLALPKRPVSALAGVPSGLHKVAATYAPQACPNCGTLNHPSAARCAGCGAPLTPKVTSEVSRIIARAS
jgi:hypothetical protein